MNLGQALEKLKFDNRLQDWNLSQGIITSKDLKTHLDKLEDLANRATMLDLDSERRRQSSLNGNGRLN